MAGLDGQSVGCIEQGGRDISSVPATKRDFGIVFLSYSLFPFFFSSRRRHTRCLSDWSSDVCSSDLRAIEVDTAELHRAAEPPDELSARNFGVVERNRQDRSFAAGLTADPMSLECRSEERRVGKECRSRRFPYA